MTNCSAVRIIRLFTISLVIGFVSFQTVFLGKSDAQEASAPMQGYSSQLGFVEELGQYKMFDSLRFHWALIWAESGYVGMALSEARGFLLY